MRVLGAVLAVVGVLLLSGHPAGAQPAGDLGGLISQLERAQVVRLPGAVTSVDAARLRQEDRVVLAPPAGLPADLAPLWGWASSNGHRLTVVEGWWVAQRGVLVRVAREALPGVLASGDVTDVVLGTSAPPPRWAAATAARLDGLPVSRPRAGVRLVSLPVRPGPSAGYAAALADRFPGELVVVAYGAWLEFAGPGADRAAQARDIAYGPLLLHRAAADVTTTELVATVLDRMAEPPPRPVYGPPRPVRISPSLYAFAGTLPMGIVLLGTSVLFWRRRKASAGPARLARAEAHARVAELGARLADDPDPLLAKRYETARTRLAEASTVADMVEVRKVAEKGLAVRSTPSREVLAGVRPTGKSRRGEGRRRMPPPTPGGPEPEPEASRRPRGATFVSIGLFVAVVTTQWATSAMRLTADEDDYTPEMAARQLRYSSVYVYPLYVDEGYLDAERAGAIIGDRPLALVVGHVPMCEEIARELSGVTVVVVSPDPDHRMTDCAGQGTSHDPDLLRDTQDAMTFAATGDDLTPYVVEYVRAFDARHPSLHRAPPSGDDSVGGLVQITVIAVLLLVAFGFVVFGAASVHRNWLVPNTRLNRLACLITPERPGGTPHERAAITDEYLRTLRDFATASTAEQRADVERRLTELEEVAGVTRGRRDP